METPAQTCARIVTALEDLARQEAAALQARDFATAMLLQDRAAPLVEHLAMHEAEIVSSDLRFRVAAVHALRSQTGEWLAGQMDQTRQDLQQMDVSRRRVAQIAPAYGRGSARPTRLSAVG